MKITVYEKPTCTTCRNLAVLLRENGIDYDKVNYFIDPLTEAQIKSLLKKAGLTAFEVLRKNEPIAKDLGITSETPNDDIIKFIAANPSILQRPIVEVGERAVLARPVEKALELIKAC
ncbi:MAG: arsenate reductase [Saprospiraceae bacterium]|nr:arsenate reductase [Pyrinomonadaceae bacterium]